MYIENMTSNTSPINYYKIIFHSALLYGLISILYYFGILSYKILENNYIMAVLAAYPIMALYYYKLDVWYYNRKIVAYKKKLIQLRSEKKKILDEVMEKETFKVAKEILEKYAPHQLHSMTSQHYINQKALPYTNNRPQFVSYARPVNRASNMGKPPAIMSSEVKPRLALPRPVLSRDRSIFDRLADIVLGDGPQNRYALICRTCGSHNGMARKEEFDFLAYRCAYCSQWNPSLKPKPQLAIGYDNNSASTPNGHITSTERNSENEHSTQKNLTTSTSNLSADDSGPTIEEMEDVLPSDDPTSKTEKVEESIDKPTSVAEDSL